MIKNDNYQKHRSLWDRTWRDSNGQVVIWQMPNKWLLGWAGFTVLSLLFSGRTADVFSWAGSISLIVWSLLEILKGANYFRHALGLLIFVFAVASLAKSF
jgi:hypothetical protein